MTYRLGIAIPASDSDLDVDGIAILPPFFIGICATTNRPQGSRPSYGGGGQSGYGGDGGYGGGDGGYGGYAPPRMYFL